MLRIRKKVSSDGLTELIFELYGEFFEVRIADVPDTQGCIALIARRAYIYKNRKSEEVIVVLERFVKEGKPQTLEDLWGSLDLYVFEPEADIIIRW